MKSDNNKEEIIVPELSYQDADCILQNVLKECGMKPARLADAKTWLYDNTKQKKEDEL